MSDRTAPTGRRVSEVIDVPDEGEALSPARRLAIAFELTEFGCEIRLQRHRREHPDATDDELSAVARAWFAERPGAAQGDVAGSVRLRVEP